MTVRRRHRAAGLATIITVGVAACSSGVPAPTAPSPTTRPSPTISASVAGPSASPSTPTRSRHWPLTGLRADEPLPDRPVLAVKIDNTSSAEPQRGLHRADLVVEEPVEGGLTRLAAFYHSELPRLVGPVRSMRTSDVGLMTATNGTLVASGGAPLTLSVMRDADVRTALPGGKPGFFRSGERAAPYDLMLHPRRLAPELRDAKPGPLLSRAGRRAGGQAGRDASELDGTRTRKLEVVFSPSHTTRWGFKKDRGWARVGAPAADGQAFIADSLLVLDVKTRSAGYRDPAGNPVPETVLTGSGRARVLAGPELTKARWSKKGPESPFRLKTREGDRLRLPPGHTWIELLPRSGHLDTH